MALGLRRRPTAATGIDQPPERQREWFEEPESAPTQKPNPEAAGRLGRKSAWRANGLDPGLTLIAASNQACGLYPFLSGAGVPLVGAPIGRHVTSNQTAFWHPFQWIKAGLVTNPNCFILADLGVGKSALAKRQLTGCLATGMKGVVMGDVKNEYGELVEKLGGQRWRIGHGGVGSINPLDHSASTEAAKRLKQQGFLAQAEALQRSATARRAALMGAIAGIALNRPVDAEERVVLAEVLPHVDSIGAFLHRLEDPHLPEQHHVPKSAVDSIYYAVKSVHSGGLAGLFTDHSSDQLDIEAPVMQIDVSAVYADGDEDATALAMLAVWTMTFGVVAANDALATAGLSQSSEWVAVLDELWMAMRSSEALVRSIDAVMRTSRTLRIAPIMSTHSVKDFRSLPTESARQIAEGFLVRSGTRLLGAVEPDEATELQAMLGLTDAEANWLIGSQATGSWHRASTQHPSKGRFLLQTGQGRPAIPLRVHLSDLELTLYDTDKRTGSSS